MRFEKLNEDKIRITLTVDDLSEKNIDLHTFMTDSIESQDLFFEMLAEAEKEIGFSTKNYLIRIEAFAMSGGSFVLTVTRTLPNKPQTAFKGKVFARKKSPSFNSINAIYAFSSFDNYFDFMNFVSSANLNCNNIAKKFSLYEFKGILYFCLIDIDYTYFDTVKLLSCISEFASFVNSSDIFVKKLDEQGRLFNKAFYAVKKV